MRTEDHRLAECRRLQDVVPPARNQRASHKNDARVFKGGSEFSDGIEHHHPAPLPRCAELTAAQRGETGRFHRFCDSIEAFRVPGRDQQMKFWMKASQLGVYPQKGFFFAGLGAGGDPQR